MCEFEVEESNMKTPRQVLLERHRSAQSKLDQVRQNALAHLALPTAEMRRQKSPGFLASMRALLRPLRWHLAGLSAAWLFILLLHVSSVSITAPVMARQKPPSPRQILLALRENRRQLLELIEAPSAAPPPVIPQRRSAIELPTAIA